MEGSMVAKSAAPEVPMSDGTALGSERAYLLKLTIHISIMYEVGKATGGGLS